MVCIGCKFYCKVDKMDKYTKKPAEESFKTIFSEFISPMLATLTDKPPLGEKWITKQNGMAIVP